MPQKLPELLTARMYSYADADRLAGVSRGTAKRWVEGYRYRDASGNEIQLPPVTPGKSIAAGGVSFADLVEIVVIGKLKELGFSVPAVRKIVSNCQELFHEPHPLSTQSFKVGGRDVFVRQDSALYSVLRRKGEVAWEEVLGPFLQTLDYREAFAVRWWPMGRTKSVVVDPEYGFGLPVIDGSGVRTEIVRERMLAGDSVAQIADDFNLTPVQVESAIQFELQRAA